MRNTRLLPLAAALLAASAASQAEVYDARSMGRGGAGLTMGEYNQLLTNPALINQFDEHDEFSFALNAGAFASDKDGMLDDVDAVQDDADELEQCGQEYANSGGTSPACSTSELDQSLAELDGKMAQIGAGGAIVIAIPNRTLPMALVARSTVDAGVQFEYSTADTMPGGTLEQIAVGAADQEDLQSELLATAVSLTEVGVNFGRVVKGYQLGAFLKAQQIELISYNESVGAFEPDDITDGEFSEKHSTVNLDLGLRKAFGGNDQFVFGATVENLVPQSFDAPNGLGDYEMDPVLTTGVGYQSSWVKAEASVDLSERTGFDLLEDRQYARVGAEFSLGRHFHLRAGYQEDLKNNVSSLATAGIGITPWDRANIDLAAQVGEGDTFGVALQLGFKI